MAKPIHEMSSWSHSSTTQAADEEAWQATRQVGPATQLVSEKEAYLGQGGRDVGRQVGAGQWELFVVCDPGEAMHLQFSHLAPVFIAVHDIGICASRRLVAGIAAAAGGPVQKLTIRRQGHGVPLATLEFAELASAGTPPLRIYTTEVDADTNSRHELARVLLAHSRLGVVLAGDLPPHALATALKPLREAIDAGPWPNRNLLMLPLSTSGALAGQAAQVGRNSDVVVRTTPPVTRPAEAWGYINATWKKLREQAAESGTPLPPIAVAAPAPAPAPSPAPPPAPFVPLALKPMPEVRPEAKPDAAAALSNYAQRCAAEIKGMVSCCVFELETQRPRAHAGAARPGPAVLASQGAALLLAARQCGEAMGLSSSRPDVAVTLASHHLLVRPVPHHAGMALHAVLDGSANLTLARLQMQRLDETVEAKQ